MEAYLPGLSKGLSYLRGRNFWGTVGIDGPRRTIDPLEFCAQVCIFLGEYTAFTKFSEDAPEYWKPLNNVFPVV